MARYKLAWGGMSVLLLILALSTQAHAQEYPASLKSQFVKEVVSRPAIPDSVPRKSDAHGFWRPYGPQFAVSMSVCAGGAIADIATSTGRESNPILRNDSGGLSVGRAVLLKAGVCGSTLLFERKHPKLMFWARIIPGLVWGGVAAFHN